MKNRDAYVAYLLLEGAFSLFFYIIITVNLVYQVETARLNPLQLVLVGTGLEVAAFLSQVPTGVFADIFSRRLSIIIGVFLTGAGFMLEGSIPRFETILLAQLGWGIGSSFIAGAEEAWIAGELGEENIGHVFLRGSQVGQVGALIGAVISVALGSIRLNLPILVGGAMFIALGFFLLVFMPEHNFQRAPQEGRHSWRKFGQTLREGGLAVRAKPILMTMLGIALFFGLASEGFDRLWTPHFLEDFKLPGLRSLGPLAWFGMMRVGVMLLSIAGAEIVRRSFDMRNNVMVARLLAVASAVYIVSVVIFGLAGSFWLALAAFWGVSLMRSMINPIYTTWLTKNSDTKYRATVISISGLTDAIGQIVGGPIAGFVGTVVSIRAGLLTATAMLAPSLLLYPRAILQEKGDVE